MERGALIRKDMPADGVFVITITRREHRNALNIALRDELAAAFGKASCDAEIAAVILAAEGSVFSAGSDLKEAAALTPETRNPSWAALWNAVETCPKPVLASVEGPALGAGFELALACDIIIAGDVASFALPEVEHGFVPGGGGTQRLVRQVGKYRAMLAILAAEPISCDEARELGIVSRRVPAGTALSEATAIASRIAAMPTAALHAAKRLLKSGPDLSLPDGLALERRELSHLNGSEELRSRTAAFANRTTRHG